MIIVTGGAGFIGSNLTVALTRQQGRSVAVVDYFGNDEKWRNLVKADLAEIVAPDALFDFLAANRYAVEAVMHLGAISATTETDVDLIMRVNVNLSRQLWDWCSENSVPFIYASSAATYGDGAQGFDDDSSPEALAALRPLNPYGWSKNLFDQMVARIVADNGPTPPHWAGLKFFNVYGPNEYHKGGQQSVIPQIHRQIQSDGRARLFKSHHPDYADGGQLRDFIWVGDCVDVMTWLLDSPDVSGIFNCGTGTARSFDDLARAVFTAMDREAAIDFIPTPENIRDKYQYFTEAKMERLRLAGYDRSFTALEDGVSSYVRDYLSAPDAYT